MANRLGDSDSTYGGPGRPGNTLAKALTLGSITALAAIPVGAVKTFNNVAERFKEASRAAESKGFFKKLMHPFKMGVGFKLGPINAFFSAPAKKLASFNEAAETLCTHPDILKKATLPLQIAAGVSVAGFLAGGIWGWRQSSHAQTRHRELVSERDALKQKVETLQESQASITKAILTNWAERTGKAPEVRFVDKVAVDSDPRGIA